MSKNTSLSESAEQDKAPAAHSGLSSDAQARRRMLLKSLGKGSTVVAAAAVPMHTLATTVTSSGQICTVSGVMSGVHSQVTNKAVCFGYSPGYYKMCSHWPNYNPVTGHAINYIGSKTFTDSSTFKSVFGSGSTSSLLNVLNNETNTEYFHWTAALLNACAGSLAKNFPYTPQQVIDLYNTGEPTHTNALNFFKAYLES